MCHVINVVVELVKKPKVFYVTANNDVHHLLLLAIKNSDGELNNRTQLRRHVRVLMILVFQHSSCALATRQKRRQILVK
jgi:hypothetical protein